MNGGGGSGNVNMCDEEGSVVPIAVLQGPITAAIHFAHRRLGSGCSPASGWDSWRSGNYREAPR